MTDANLRRLHEIERELVGMHRDETDPAWSKLLDEAQFAISRAAFGPHGRTLYVPPPPGFE